MERLKINTFNAIGGIVAAVMTATMIFWMFSNFSVVLYYGCGFALLATNILGLLKQKSFGGRIVGNILGIIAASLHALSGFLALPAMVLYIIAVVFLFKDKVNLNGKENKFF